jgi:integrase
MLTRGNGSRGSARQQKVRKLGYHALRKYVASILDDKYKASRKSIQKLLRHKKESTTERYLYQIHSDLKSMAGLAVPKKYDELEGL